MYWTLPFSVCVLACVYVSVRERKKDVEHSVLLDRVMLQTDDLILHEMIHFVLSPKQPVNCKTTRAGLRCNQPP